MKLNTTLGFSRDNSILTSSSNIEGILDLDHESQNTKDSNSAQISPALELLSKTEQIKASAIFTKDMQPHKVFFNKIFIKNQAS